MTLTRLLIVCSFMVGTTSLARDRAVVASAFHKTCSAERKVEATAAVGNLKEGKVKEFIDTHACEFQWHCNSKMNPENRHFEPEPDIEFQNKIEQQGFLNLATIESMYCALEDDGNVPWLFANALAARLGVLLSSRDLVLPEPIRDNLRDFVYDSLNSHKRESSRHPGKSVIEVYPSDSIPVLNSWRQSVFLFYNLPYLIYHLDLRPKTLSELHSLRFLIDQGKKYPHPYYDGTLHGWYFGNPFYPQYTITRTTSVNYVERLEEMFQHGCRSPLPHDEDPFAINTYVRQSLCAIKR